MTETSFKNFADSKPVPRNSFSSQSPLVRMAWALCLPVCLLAIENIWIDPRVARRFNHRLPSLVPQPLTGTWLLVLMVLVIALILAVVCQILLLRNSRMPKRIKALTGLLVLSTLLLSAKWVVATGGSELLASQQVTAKKHSVTLHWTASTTRGVSYNIYRGPAKGKHPDKLNPNPVEDVSFTDDKVISGKTYFYVIRAVDPFTHESIDSNEISVTIP